jgi:hypothetical protein
MEYANSSAVVDEAKIRMEAYLESAKSRLKAHQEEQEIKAAKSELRWKHVSNVTITAIAVIATAIVAGISDRHTTEIAIKNGYGKKTEIAFDRSGLKWSSETTRK